MNETVDKIKDNLRAEELAEMIDLELGWKGSNGEFVSFQNYFEDEEAKQIEGYVSEGPPLVTPGFAKNLIININNFDLIRDFEPSLVIESYSSAKNKRVGVSKSSGFKETKFNNRIKEIPLINQKLFTQVTFINILEYILNMMVNYITLI